ncbi:Noc2-domain-containing protein [Neoconidiobolus thromboides FSU 785]|nr:Noc2-domain-containing protein [Neoconidiobolus thromboides FSU 785]
MEEDAEQEHIEEDITDDIEEDIEEGDIEEEEEEYIKEMEKLKEKDPEFYKYIEENDKAVLDFGEGGDKDEVENAEADEMNGTFDIGSTVLTVKQITSWEQHLIKSKSLNTAKELILAFRDGTHINDKNEEAGLIAKYSFNSDKVFNKVMVAAMRSLPGFFNHHLKTGNNPKTLPSQSKSWKKMQALVKTYLESIVHMLSQITEPDMIKFILDRTQDLIKYIACFPKILKSFLKLWLEFFGSSNESSVYLSAFSLIRKISIVSPFALDLSLKGVYSTYIRATKSINNYNFLRLNVLKSLSVELFGHDFDKSYQLAFTSIRQLAVHLRNSINNKTKESYTLIYNWQFISSISFWSKVLSTYCNKDIEAEHGESPLRPLIYPLAQVTLGVIRLIPSPKYFPLRLNCIKALLALTHKTTVYIPISPYLIEMLESSEFQRRASNSTLKPFNLNLVLKAPKEHLGTKTYQDMLSDEIHECLLAHLASFSNSIAFPEITLPLIHYLKRFKKASKNMKINKLLENILLKIDATTITIQKHRSQLDFAPSDVEKMKAFVDSVSSDDTPIGQYYTKYLEMKAKKEALLNDAEESD